MRPKLLEYMSFEKYSPYRPFDTQSKHGPEPFDKLGIAFFDVIIIKYLKPHHQKETCDLGKTKVENYK